MVRDFLKFNSSDASEWYDFSKGVWQVFNNTLSCNSFTSQIKVQEKEDSYYAVIQATGLEKDDISIISKIENDIKYLYVEFLKDTDFVLKGIQKILIGRLGDVNKISAKLMNGILSITVLKDLSKSVESKIDIN